jgi:hypothetical protein
VREATQAVPRGAGRDRCARLDLGLSQQEYSDLLGAGSVAYSQIEVSALGRGACLSAGAKLEDAFNSYNKLATP